jgi:ATP-dependent DNA helicase DinG
MARALGLAPPADDGPAAAMLLPRLAAALLAVPDRPDWPQREGAWSAARTLHRAGWGWAPFIGARLAMPSQAERGLFNRLPQWEETAPRPAPRTVPADPAGAEARLAALAGPDRVPRAGQRAMALAAAAAFAPRRAEGHPRMMLAEAGTGIGKTLAYLAPASLWAEQAGGTVWISTYTRALQRQLDAETRAIATRPGQVVIRKGRENYLCLLNLEDAMQGGFAGRAAVLAHLVARWAAYSRDGDMVGGDLPGWLTSLFRRAGATALTDRRGECVYAGCPHYRKCFIERAERAAREADLVIANHALTMINAARGRGEPPTRLVFDEGHHLFDAADATFATALTGQEAIELRRWIIGPETKARGRRRGLAARLADVVSYDDAGAAALDQALNAAQALPADGWLARIADDAPFGPLETLLGEVRSTCFARARAVEAGYGIETELAQPDGALVSASAAAAEALEALVRPLAALARRLEAVLEDAPDWLDPPARARVEGALNALALRRELLGAWIALLARVGGAGDPDFIDWLAVDRVEGRDFDIGLHRRWLDPTRPLARVVLAPAHGVLVTSATLRAQGERGETAGDSDASAPGEATPAAPPSTGGWARAIARSGAAHLPDPPLLFGADSPFDYAAQAQVLIVTDVSRTDGAGVANAYARLVEAAGGGTLGLFTAISRLRAVHARIADRMARAGLPLFAQHVDPIDTGTLIDMFRDDPHASLLGTDALRDGVDVPGDSLRLVVMERVPWPRPDVLHGARRMAAAQAALATGRGDGAQAYDDAIVRARLAQAFGRLIRRSGDKGVFVILSPALPSRLLDAFPAGIVPRRVGLDEATRIVRASVGVNGSGGGGVVQRGDQPVAQRAQPDIAD